MKERLDRLFHSYNAPYGAFDCLLNAVAVFYEIYQLPLDDLNRINWYVWCSPEEDIFGGSFPDRFYKSLSASFSVQLEELASREFPLKKLFILPIETSYLPYVIETFSYDEQKHYVVAYLEGRQESLQIWDSYYKVKSTLSIDKANESLIKHQHLPILNVLINDTYKTSPIDKAPIFKEDYKKLYSNFYHSVIQMFADLCNLSHEVQQESKLNRYFGYIRSIVIAREKHFLSMGNPYHAHRKNVINSWNKLEKNLIKQLITKSLSVNKFSELLGEVMKCELHYLDEVVQY